MITINAQLLDNKNIKLSKKNFGNKLDNSITKVIFDEIAEEGLLNNKYVAFLSPTSEIFLFPLNSEDNSFIVSYSITQYAGVWKMLYLATNTAIENEEIDYDYKVYVSNSIDFTITENFLTDIIEQPIIDDNLEIFYEQLNQTILYLNSEGFQKEIQEQVIANFELTEEQISQIAENLKNDEEFKEDVKGESIYEYWINDIKYNVNDRVNKSLKFYLNKDFAEYFRINYSSGYQTLLFSITNFNYILKTERNVLTLNLYSSDGLIESYTEEDILYNGVNFYNDNIILSIVDINNFKPLLKEEYLTVTEYTRKYGYQFTDEDKNYVAETLKNDEEFKESVKGEKGDAGRGVYTEYIELNRYEIGGIDSSNNFYWNKDVLEFILSKNGSYNGKVVLKTDYMTLTYNAFDEVFNVYVNTDLSTRVDWINISALLSEEAPYVRLQNSTEIIEIEESLLLRDPYISIEKYSETYLKGERGEDGADGTGISNIELKEKTTLGNTYTMNLSDGTSYDFIAPKGENGESIYEAWLNSIRLKEEETIEITEKLYLSHEFYSSVTIGSSQVNLFWTENSIVFLGKNFDTYDNIEKVYHSNNGVITVLSTVEDALNYGFSLPIRENFRYFEGELELDKQPVYKDKFLTITEYSETYLKGTDGHTPVKGTDYWTEEDINEIETYCKNYIDTEILGGAS